MHRTRGCSRCPHHSTHRSIPCCGVLLPRLQMVLSSNVPAPFIASSLPQLSAASVFSVMLERATIFPRKSVVVPESRSCQPAKISHCQPLSETGFYYNGRAGCGGERTANLEDPERISIAWALRVSVTFT